MIKGSEKKKTTRMNIRGYKIFLLKLSSGWKVLKVYVEICKHNSLPQNNFSSVLSDTSILYKYYSIRPLPVLVTN